MTLIADRRGSELKLDGSGVVCLFRPGEPPYRVGLHGLCRIVVQGETSISSGLLRACAMGGVDVVVLPGRGMGEPAHLLPSTGRRVRLRIAQFHCYLDPDRRIDIARRIVAAKIAHQATWIAAHGLHADFGRFIKGAAEVEDLATLMGVEGAASARYFALWARLWRTPWEFRGRNRRPPRDPVNAALSLGYTLAMQYIGRMAALRGLDTAVGFLHEPETGRPSLALDLVERLRPWVDQWVWQMLSEGHLQPAHFYVDPKLGCRLTKEARGIYFDAWHAAEDNWLQKPARRTLASLLTSLRSCGPLGSVCGVPPARDPIAP